MKCPTCGTDAQLTTPDYGYGYGAEFACYRCDPYGRRFTSRSAEATAESNASRAMSRSNAEHYQPARKYPEEAAAPSPVSQDEEGERLG